MRRTKLWLPVIGSLLVVVLAAVFHPLLLLAQEGAAHNTITPEVMKWGFITAAVSVGISTTAGAIAVGMVGAAAMGAIGERPEIAARALIFVGLAEGIAIYCLIVSAMIIGKLP